MEWMFRNANIQDSMPNGFLGTQKIESITNDWEGREKVEADKLWVCGGTKQKKEEQFPFR
ncbi:hypothetical protein RUM44_007183 [Polyplax serrata]|uniref:Uncharacterized protein n=1 Tax=Polyplax serrata TaxID=468196 RepID=A0ABR1B009_POLSC